VMNVHMQRQSDNELVGFVKLKLLTSAADIARYNSCYSTYIAMDDVRLSGMCDDNSPRELTVNCIAKMDDKSGQSFWSCGSVTDGRDIQEGEQAPSSSQTRSITSASANAAPPNAPGSLNVNGLKVGDLTTYNGKTVKIVSIDPNSGTASIQMLTWTDPRTGLMWAEKDNDNDVTWKEASNYCRNLSLGGYSNWRLPTIDELAGIYDPTQDGHVKGNLQLSGGGGWSSTAGTASREPWAFVFSIGERVSYRLGYSRYDVVRALCVRR
jgi:hypothetical protein